MTRTGSYVITWKTPDGELRRNQVWAENRDKAIWRIALLMQTSQPHRTGFVSCEQIAEDAPVTPAQAESAR